MASDLTFRRVLAARRLTAGGVGAGILLFGAVAAMCSVRVGAAGHGTYVLAKVFFPFAMISTLLSGRLTWFGITLALLQFPLYSVMVAGAILRGAVRRTAMMVLLLLVLVSVVCLMALKHGPFAP